MPEKIHVFTRFNDRVVGPLQDVFPEAEIISLTEEDFAAKLSEVEFLIAMKPPRGHWGKATNMKLLQSFGAGIDHLMPMDDLPESVAVCNAAGLAAEPMSEYALTLILMCIKRTNWAITGHRGGYWRQYMPGSARGSKICILGMGRIGEATAERCVAMGMTVIGTQRTPKPSAFATKVYPSSETATAIADADVVVSILPLTDDTHGLLDEAMMRRMKPGSYVINLGRGGQVVEADLIKLLEDGHLAGAALDVAETEPLPEGDPLWTAPNLIITPHVAGGFPDYMGGISRLFGRNVRAFEAGQALETQIDRERGY